jgi:hypothetical protein
MANQAALEHTVVVVVVGQSGQIVVVELDIIGGTFPSGYGS